MQPARPITAHMQARKAKAAPTPPPAATQAPLLPGVLHACTPARARQVQLILEHVDAIPTLSPIAARVLKLGSANDVEIDQLAKVIETDPALATRILGLCRRSDKGLGDKITSVKRAVVMLGLEAVRSAVLAVSVYDLLAKDEQSTRTDESVAGSVPASATPGFDRTGFWKHSVAVACAAELIAAEHKHLKILPEEAFLAGLLHGMGRIVLSSVLPRAYDAVARLAQRRGATSASIEHEILGIDHHAAGRRVAAHWELPAPIGDVIWLHDQPAPAVIETPHASLVLLITAARALCRHLHLGFSGDFTPAPELSMIWHDAGLSSSAHDVSARLHTAVSQRLSLLGIDAGTTPELMLDSLASATNQLARTTATLDERARLATTQARILDAVAQFQAASPTATTQSELAAALLQSTDTAFTKGFHALLLAQDDTWTLITRNARNVVEHELDTPTSDATPGLDALRQPGVSMGCAPLLHWLGSAINGAPDVRALQVLSISAHGALLTDRPLPPANLLPALTACWSTAIANAAAAERARRLEEQLVHANRSLVATQGKLAQREALARLGETAAGAAHEFNNPLTVIAGRAELLLTRLQGERDKAAVSAIATAAQQISGMIASLHLLGKVPTPNPGPTNLVESVRRAISKARKRTNARIDVSIELLRLPESFFTDGDLLVGALVELLTNALEACPRGPVTLTEERVGDTLSFVVEDHGPGLTEHALRHAYDPFFSQREAGRGRGMGLTRARVMAQALGGDLHLASEPNKGCRATITIRDLSTPTV